MDLLIGKARTRCPAGGWHRCGHPRCRFYPRNPTWAGSRRQVRCRLQEEGYCSRRQAAQVQWTAGRHFIRGATNRTILLAKSCSGVHLRPRVGGRAAMELVKRALSEQCDELGGWRLAGALVEVEVCKATTRSDETLI